MSFAPVGSHNFFLISHTFFAGVFLPQRFHLDKLHTYSPDATFILNLRPSQDWLHSVTNWFGLGGRFLTRFKVDISDPNINRNERPKVDN